MYLQKFRNFISHNVKGIFVEKLNYLFIKEKLDKGRQARKPKKEGKEGRQ